MGYRCGGSGGGRKQVRLLLDVLRRGAFPCASGVADAPLLASLVDMVVLVVQHNTTDRDLVIKVARRLRLVNPALVGAVLNNVNIDRNRDAYYAGYYYLSEDEGKTPKKRRVANTAGVG